MTSSGTCYRLVVAGHLSQTAVELIDSRFGSAVCVRPSGPDVAVDLTADQPALRALLTLLWDLGHDLVAVRECSDAARAPEGLLAASRTAGLSRQLGSEPARFHSPDPTEEHTP